MMVRRFIFLSILMLALSAPAAACDSVAFTRDRYGRILVPIRTGTGTDWHFMLDTAAHRFAVSRNLVRLNQYTDRGLVRIHYLSSGGMVHLPVANVAEIQLGHDVKRDRFAAIFPNMAEADGILGSESYAGYLLHVNGPAGTVALCGNAGSFSSAGWKFAHADISHNGAMMIDTPYHGQQVTVMLASGLSRTVMDVTAAQLLFPDRFEAGTYGMKASDHDEAVTMGLPSVVKHLNTVVLKDFHVQGWQLGDIEVGVTSLPVREQTGYMNTALIMLGADVLAQKDYVIDNRWSQVWWPKTDDAGTEK